MTDRPEWFAPKRYGYGSGKPIAWQGWAIAAIFVAIIAAASFLLGERKLLAFLSIVVPASAIFILISARTTRGGWRWRWGERD